MNLVAVAKEGIALYSKLPWIAIRPFQWFYDRMVEDAEEDPPRCRFIAQGIVGSIALTGFGVELVKSSRACFFPRNGLMMQCAVGSGMAISTVVCGLFFKNAGGIYRFIMEHVAGYSPPVRLVGQCIVTTVCIRFLGTLVESIESYFFPNDLLVGRYNTVLLTAFCYAFDRELNVRQLPAERIVGICIECLAAIRMIRAVAQLIVAIRMMRPVEA